MIALLGTGLLGSGFARALARRGEAVRLWNRSADKAAALVGAGLTAHASPAEAVAGAQRVHVVLSDDEVVDAVLAQARLAVGAVVYDHTTTSAAGAARRTEAFAARGITYLHAPVFMGPANALEGTGLMLVSGDRAVVAAATPLLAPMTGKLVDLGPRVDAAAAFKLLGNLLLMGLTAGFCDVLGLGRALAVTPAEIATLFEHFNPGMSLPARFDRLRAGAWDEPSWELGMARKDARLMLEAAAAAGVELGMLPGLAARMDALLEEGLGHSDWTVVARDHLVPRS